MSYAFELTDRAQAEFRQLEIWLQEETLDELERLAADPFSAFRKTNMTAMIHDVVREHNGIKFYVFITVRPDPNEGVMHISSFGSWSRPMTGP